MPLLSVDVYYSKALVLEARDHTEVQTFCKVDVAYEKPHCWLA